MAVYYVEVNAICMILLVLLYFQVKATDIITSKQRILTHLLRATFLFCLSDMVSGVFRGMTFSSARVILEISNGMYYEMLVLISWLWCAYVYLWTTSDGTLPKRRAFITFIPVIVFTFVALMNPWTHWLFNFTPDNFYLRNNGIYFHWLIVWSYFLIPTVKVLCQYFKETNVLRKRELQPLIFFIVAPIVASILQMAFYGVTTTQVGITVSLVMICLRSQDSQILTDALTGINNRRAMELFIDNQLQHHCEAQYTLIMIDVDHFKLVNDKYGHMMGDIVLQKTAEALKQSCTVMSNRVHLSRFGGDEFVILGVDCSDQEVHHLLDTITNEIQNETKENVIPCDITVSIGYTQGICSDDKGFRNLLEKADAAMYIEKAKRVSL